MAATVASASLESSSDAAPSAKIRTCADARVTIAGTRGDDRIVADDESDVIRAGRGDDVIEAGAGTDRICGGPSEDEIDWGEGSDRVRGGAADDLIRGGEGNDELTGLGGTDEAEGGAGIDGCVVESHTQCEADLQVSGSVQLPVIGGALIPARLDVSNLGPTAATNARATAVGTPSPEFVAAASDERCYETATEGVACWVGALKAGASISFPIAVRFPDCPPAPTTITFSHAVQDQGTSDPFPAGYSATVPLDPAASCP